MPVAMLECTWPRHGAYHAPSGGWKNMGKVLTLRAPAGSAVQAGSTSLVDEAYQALKTAIRENVFPPGHQAAEPEIARQLGMSRTPVHEAIIRLQEEGLVQVLPR